jgi:hypothetical protein
MSDDGEDNTTSLEQRASGQAWPPPQGKTGRSAACGYHAPGAVPVRLRASWPCPAVAAKAACQPGVRRRHEGWSVSLSPSVRRGMLPLIGARLQPDWGEPNVRLIGGREETGASRRGRAARGASRLPDKPTSCPPATGSARACRRITRWRRSDRRSPGAGSNGRSTPTFAVALTKSTHTSWSLKSSGGCAIDGC